MQVLSLRFFVRLFFGDAMTAQDVGMVVRVGEYRCQGVIARGDSSFLVAGGVLLRVLALELQRCFSCREGGDVEGPLCAWGEERAAHLMGDDAHVEAEVDLDAGMN